MNAAAQLDPNDPFALHDMECALKKLHINFDNHPIFMHVAVKRRGADGQIYDLYSAEIADYVAKTRVLGLQYSNLQSTINNIFSALNFDPLWFTGWHGEVSTMGLFHRQLVEMDMWLGVNHPPSNDCVQLFVSIVWSRNNKPTDPNAPVKNDDALISGLCVDLATKSDALNAAHAALKQICEIIAAPAPVTPAEAVEAVRARFATPASLP